MEAGEIVHFPYLCYVYLKTAIAQLNGIITLWFLVMFYLVYLHLIECNLWTCNLGMLVRTYAICELKLRTPLPRREEGWEGCSSKNFEKKPLEVTRSCFVGLA